MTLEQLQYLMDQGEGLRTEFKEAGAGLPRSLYETVVSFANTDGGAILLGVTDHGRVTGIEPDRIDKLKQDLITALKSRDCIDPPLYIEPVAVLAPADAVLVLQIEAASQVHRHAGAVFIREHSSDINISRDQQRLSDLYFRKKNFFTESQIYPRLTLQDLDENLFDKARQLIRNYRSDHPWLLVSNEQMLKDSILWKKDFISGQEGLTLAAALIFGREHTIQSLLPAYKVEAMVRRENTDRWDDRLTLRKNLIDTYLELKTFINRHLPEKFHLENGQRTDLRDKIFREIIGNIIVHREYTSALSTELVIHTHEVVTTNPNKALFHGSIDPAGFNPYPKNPNIRRFFTAFGWTDEIGSGIRNTNKYLPLYVHNAKPVFIEDDTFKIIIPLSSASLSDYATVFHQWLDLPAEAKVHFDQSMAAIPLPGSLSGASWDDLILHLVPSWHKKGALLPAFNWPKNQIVTTDGIKKVPSWQKKGTQLLHKKAYYYITILMLAAAPVKLKELMQWLNYKNEKTFRDIYLKPLRESGLVSLTNPGNPTDPENRYKTSVAGIQFIAGRDFE